LIDLEKQKEFAMKKNVYNKLGLVLGALLVVVAHHLTYGSTSFTDTIQNILDMTKQAEYIFATNLINESINSNQPLEDKGVKSIQSIESIIAKYPADNFFLINFSPLVSLYNLHFCPDENNFMHIRATNIKPLPPFLAIQIITALATGYYNGNVVKKDREKAYVCAQEAKTVIDIFSQNLNQSFSTENKLVRKSNNTVNAIIQEYDSVKILHDTLKKVLDPVVQFNNLLFFNQTTKLTTNKIQDIIQQLEKIRLNEYFSTMSENDQFDCFFYQLLLKFINYNLKYEEKQTNTLAEIDQLSSVILNNFIIPNSWQYNNFYALFELCNPQILAGSKYRQGKIILKDYMKKLLAPKEYKNLPIYQYLPKDF